MEDIKNTSYCSKDFGTLYPELLDLAKRLSNEWDPSQSNETDPGVVLLKLAAAVGDHNNYNIDKNTLENFIDSAKQDKSVRSIVEMNGYTPEYYISANGDVSFTYSMPTDGNETPDTFIIPRFSLVISSADDSVCYTQAEELPIIYNDLTSSYKSTTSSCLFIEGTKQTLTVNGSTNILTENLDDNNRIYLPETMVAQNAIYVRYSDDAAHNTYGFWQRDNYLSVKTSGSRIFKVDYDSDKGLPYIEFPSDISNIIESGLNISYFVTTGVSGNVAANTLTKIVSPTVVVDRNGVEHNAENFSLTNVSAITNGKNPETIAEMHKSFKKVVGTFNTLVTREDYAKRIFKLMNSLDNPFVSNVFVSDRNSDINKAAKIMTADKNGAYIENISLQRHQLTMDTSEIYTAVPTSEEFAKGTMIVVREGASPNYTYNIYVNMSSTELKFEKYNTISLNDFSILSDAMTPYDLVIYALKAFSLSEYTQSAPYKALEKSYTIINDDTRRQIVNLIEEDKCINHVFKAPLASAEGSVDDVYCYKNYAPLNITITPYYKVTKAIKNDITNNIYRALSENFNPRTLEWGKGLDSLEIKDVILNCDDRIRDVNITPIQYKTRVLKCSTSGDTEIDLKGTNTAYFVDLVAKNILAGRVCLFDFDERFDLDYGQKDGVIYSDIKEIGTEVKIRVTPESNDKVFSYITTNGVKNVFNDVSGKYYCLIAAHGIAQNNSYELNFDTTTNIGEVFYVNSSNSEETTETEFRATRDRRYKITYTGSSLSTSQTKAYTAFSGNGVLTIEEINYTKSTADATENVNYTLHKNETINIISPNYYSDVSYGVYVNYRYIDDAGRTIHADTDYKLQSGQRIILIYTKDGVEQKAYLTTGQTIKASFDLVPTDTASNTIRRDYTDETGIYKDAKFKSLSSNQTIATRKMMMTELNNTSLRCYWNVNNNGSNTLFSSGQTERILEVNEFFVYTNESLNEMVLLGSGTKLIRSANDDNDWTIVEDRKATQLSDITALGIASDINWQTVNLAGKPLQIVEMSVVSLSENDNIRISGWTGSAWAQGETPFIDNNWRVCDGTIVYTSNGVSTSLPTLEDHYLIRSRLDIVCSKDSPQELYAENTTVGSENAIQTVNINDGTTSHTITGSTTDHITLQFSQPIIMLGDANLDISEIAKLDLYKYNNTVDISKFTSGTTSKQTIVVDNNTSADGYIGTQSSAKQFQAAYPFYYNSDSGDYLLPIRIEGTDVDITAKVVYYSGNVQMSVNIVDYNVSSAASSLLLKGDSMYFISPTSVPDNIHDLYLVLTWEVNEDLQDAEIINVFNLQVSKGLNSLITKSNIKADVMDRMKSIIQNSDKPSTKYYYTYDVNSGLHINLDTYCTVDPTSDSGYSSLAFDNPAIMFDPYNIASDKTIAQIDIRNSTVNIESGMMRD